MATGRLTAPQLRALLDILVHHETYAEVQSFQSPEAIETYGWPFVDRDEKGRPARPHGLSSSPLLQLLFTRLVLGAPAVRDLSAEFWSFKFKGIMKQFGDADLSDSYDRGTLGMRKTLATIVSAIHEAVTRGLLSGVSYDTMSDLHSPYEGENAEDLVKAWRDCICHLVHGSLIDEIFGQLTRTNNLEEHSPALRGAVEYAELHIANFLHHVFILSAEGPYLVGLIENVHKLMPYGMISWAFQFGNAASIINAMSKLFLSKVNIRAILKWMGLTSYASSGMNIMQSIFSFVLESDAADFRKVVKKMRTTQEIISNEHMTAIDDHIAADRDKRDSIRKKSIREQRSIIATIFETHDQSLLGSLTERQHISCLEYYGARLEIRDREQIIGVLCRSNPDLTTAIFLEGLGVFGPMIRAVHAKVKLHKHIGAIENFLSDFIKTTKPKTQDSNPRLNPLGVEDLVKLLRRNRHLLWAYLHDICSGCPELKDTWRGWMKDAMKAFRRGVGNDPYEINLPVHEGDGTDNTGDIGLKLQAAFQNITNSQRQVVLKQIEAHSKYLATLEALSRTQMQHIIDKLHGRGQTDSDDSSGFGIYASRCQALLDGTLITPLVPYGLPRFGKEVKSLRGAKKTGKQGVSGSSATNIDGRAQTDSINPTAPDVSAVIEALGPQFKIIVANISRDGLPKVEHREQP
ncbi:hypothetical protein O1611_g1605 [Lasiodiplodia mahajangana]|uniref:Uncharacterized protein n=1 Tax=Lasiodiplodia mahajangana TaxID=1108764 RepID=A0ACC2JWW8_9PEZI|nr:hypothetical protein O1611_g1605 [Lasiodiplodia mahajangana]